MNGNVIHLVMGILFSLALTQSFAQAPGTASWRAFQAIDIYVDSGAAPLAAYQIEFRSRSGNARIVGVEGGDPAPFSAAPHYDPDAMKGDRVILAAFSLKDVPTLPSGKSRVATIHVALDDARSPDYVIQLDVAAGSNGATIAASASFEEGIRR